MARVALDGRRTRWRTHKAPCLGFVRTAAFERSGVNQSALMLPADPVRRARKWTDGLGDIGSADWGATWLRSRTCGARRPAAARERTPGPPGKRASGGAAKQWPTGRRPASSHKRPQGRRCCSGGQSPAPQAAGAGNRNTSGNALTGSRRSVQRSRVSRFPARGSARSAGAGGCGAPVFTGHGAASRRPERTATRPEGEK